MVFTMYGVMWIFWDMETKRALLELGNAGQSFIFKCVEKCSLLERSGFSFFT